MCGALVERGWEVRGFLHGSDGLDWLKDLPIEIFRGDVTEPESLAEAIRGVTHVFHLAGAVKAQNPKEFMHVNRDGTRNLLEQAIRQQRGDTMPNRVPPRFVLFSSISAAGPNAERGHDAESCPRRGPVSDYGESKLASERVAEEYRDRVPIVILRFPPIYGPRDRAGLSLVRLLAFGIRPRLDITMSVCYVADAVEAAIGVAENSDCGFGPFAVCDGNTYTFEVWASKIEAALGRKTVTIRIPRWLLRRAAWWNELLSPTMPIFNRDKAREMSCRVWTCTCDALHAETGFAPKYDLAAGARLTIDWYRKHKWLYNRDISDIK